MQVTKHTSNHAWHSRNTFKENDPDEPLSLRENTALVSNWGFILIPRRQIRTPPKESDSFIRKPITHRPRISMSNNDLVLHLFCAEVWMLPGRRRLFDVWGVGCEEGIVLVF